MIVLEVEKIMAPTRSPCLGASDYVFFLKRQIDKGSNNPTSDEDDDDDTGLVNSHHSLTAHSDGQNRMIGQGFNPRYKNEGNRMNGSLDCPEDLPKLSELLKNLSDDLKSAPSG